MSAFKSRIAAVVASTAILAVAGTTGAVAAKMIDGGDIKNGTVTTKDIKNNTLKGRDIKNGSIGFGDMSERAKSKLAGQDGVDGKDAEVAPYRAVLANPVAIENIGGPINDNNTNLETGFTLPAGTYLINVSGAFMDDEASETEIAVYPQLSLWIDKSQDGNFQWKEGEGDISPNALMPNAKDRHISVSGQSIVTLDEETHVGLLGFGYAADQSAARSGDIDVVNAVVTATPISAN